LSEVVSWPSEQVCLLTEPRASTTRGLPGPPKPQCEQPCRQGHGERPLWRRPRTDDQCHPFAATSARTCSFVVRPRRDRPRASRAWASSRVAPFWAPRRVLVRPRERPVQAVQQPVQCAPRVPVGEQRGGPVRHRSCGRPRLVVGFVQPRAYARLPARLGIAQARGRCVSRRSSRSCKCWARAAEYVTPWAWASGGASCW
jgi:hypothetical protein